MNDIPIGLMMTLAENEQAMLRFAALPEDARKRVVAQAGSRTEMRAIVQALT